MCVLLGGGSLYTKRDTVYTVTKCKIWPPWTDILLRFTPPSDAFITECWSTESKLTHWNMEYMYITRKNAGRVFFGKSLNAARRHINQLLTWSSVISLRHGVNEEGVKNCYWSNNPFLSLVTRAAPRPPFLAPNFLLFTHWKVNINSKIELKGMNLTVKLI